MTKSRKLPGPRGLLLDLLLAATDDLTSNKKEERGEAAAFFLSDWYKHFLELLNLPANWLPEGYSRKEIITMSDGFYVQEGSKEPAWAKRLSKRMDKLEKGFGVLAELTVLSKGLPTQETEELIADFELPMPPPGVGRHARR